MRKLFAILTMFFVSACGTKYPDMAIDQAPMKPNEVGVPRITVERIGVLGDALAYNGRRGIYIITDMKTGKEFIGISGIGVSETGGHRSGKSSVSDER